MIQLTQWARNNYDALLRVKITDASFAPLLITKSITKMMVAFRLPKCSLKLFTASITNNFNHVDKYIISCGVSQ